MLRNAFRLGWVGLAAVMGVVACSDDSGGSSGPGGVQTVCGITCGGTASCTDGSTGSVSAQGGACVLSASQGTATLKCDGTIAATSPQGAGTGTWTGGGTSVSLTIEGDSFDCTITPPASNTGGEGGGTGGFSGGTGGGTGGFSGGTGGGTGGSTGDPCQDCITAQCGAEAQACGTSSDCAGLLNCIVECSDEACYSACESQYPSGVTPLNNYLNCVMSACETACSG